jgi:anaerobic ribonucleoside-triphosphate reductase
MTQEELREKRTKTEVYSRIVGYIRPIADWNDSKRAEWDDRVVFKEQ